MRGPDRAIRGLCQEILAQRIAELWTGTLQLDGSWILQADVTSDHIRDKLMSMISEGDSLVVIGAGKDAAWAGFQEADANWLVENIYRSKPDGVRLEL